MKALLCLAIGSAAACTSAHSHSAAPAEIEVRAAPSLPITIGAVDNFSGTARISSPFQAQTPGRAGGATVSFEPGVRTAWHTHPLGQTLVVTAGLGLVQQQGKAVQVIRPGDVVIIPAHVRHWHGAAPDAAMTHVAIAEKDDGISVRWQEKVTDADYQTAWANTGLSLERRTRVQTPGETLSPRQRAIALIAAFAASSDMLRLNTTLNHALDTGLSLSEAKEVLVQLYAYAGFPRSLNALSELLKVVDTRRQQGILDAPGREPNRAIPMGHELILAGQVNQSEISGGPVQGPVFDFAPVINQFLQAHLFDDIFERDNLDWPSRELATVGALAATPGAEAQLRSHMRASLRVGLTPAQLRQLTQALEEEVGAQAASRAREALTQALAQASKG